MMFWPFAIAAVLLILVPLMPTLLRARIKVLRWLRWNWAADTLENHFQSWVLVLRVVLAVAATFLLLIGLSHIA